MADDFLIAACPTCGARNRVAAERLRDRPCCGRCAALLSIALRPTRAAGPRDLLAVGGLSSLAEHWERCFAR